MIEYYHHHKSNCDPIFFGGKNEDCPLYLGVELECDGITDTGRNTEKISDDVESLFPNDFIYCEEDGSLSYGFENITQPATLEYHLSRKENYEDMFRLLLNEHLFSFNVRSAGLHIHVNKSFFGVSDAMVSNIKKVCILCNKYWDNIVKISRRTKNSLSNWADKISAVELADIEDGIRYCEGSRYSAVNISNEDTVEFRFFKGTLNPDVFFACLSFVDGLCRIAKETADVNSLSWEDILSRTNGRPMWLWEKTMNRRVSD